MRVSSKMYIIKRMGTWHLRSSEGRSGQVRVSSKIYKIKNLGIGHVRSSEGRSGQLRSSEGKFSDKLNKTYWHCVRQGHTQTITTEHCISPKDHKRSLQ